MKTIMVVFSGKGKDLTEEEISKMRQYSFNVEADVQVGQVVESKQYNKPITVVRVLDELFLYYNVKTFELTNDNTSYKVGEIKVLQV